MPTVHFIKKGKLIEPDYDGIFFDGNNPGEVINFVLDYDENQPPHFSLTWDGPWVSQIVVGKPAGYRIRRNEWLLWFHAERRFIHSTTQLVKDTLEMLDKANG